MEWLIWIVEGQSSRFQSDKTLEKVQTSQRGFAALEGDLEGAMRTCRLYARLQEPVRGFQ